MRHLGAILLGLGIILLIWGLSAGKDFLMGLALLVVCTGGLGLIPLLLGAWLAGVFVLTTLGMFLSVAPDRAKKTTNQDNVPILMNYIVKAERQGVPQLHVKEALARNGWGQDQIAEAYRRLDGK